jgi:hypothetical protein
MSQISYNDEIKLVDHLTRVLEHRLAGRDPRRHVARQPVDVCQLGVLAPYDPNADTYKQPSSLGLEFMVRDGEPGSIEVEGQLAFYVRRLPTLAEQQSVAGEASGGGEGTLVEVIERCDLSFGPLELPLADGDDRGHIQHLLDKATQALAARADAWRVIDRRPSVPASATTSAEAFTRWLQGTLENRPLDIPPLKVRLQVVARHYGDRKRVTVYLRNETPQGDNPTENNYRIIADVRLRVRVQGTLVPVEILPVAEDYQFDRNVWVVGRNCGALREGNCLTTRCLAIYRQKRMTTRAEPPAPFQDLAQRPLEVLRGIHEAMRAYAQSWEQELDRRGYTGEFAEAARADLRQFREEIHRFAAGLAALRADARLEQAFTAMNRVFARMSPYPSWRLFQIVFIVSQLPALALREGITAGEWAGERYEWADDLDRAVVLWFPTGGGKTEAYLGLVCTAMLYDRLRGKRLGVTAWLRFPLRMLSLQQLQRAMRVLYGAEQERLALGLEGDPFRLGYLAGRGNSPNQLDDAELQRWSQPGEREKLRLVPNCPACGGLETVEVHPQAARLCFEHRCRQCGYQLPLDVSDAEVLRHQSTVVVGTVDKMAALAYQPALSMLWQVRRRCPQHGYFLDKCLVKSCSVNSRQLQTVNTYDPGPSLHIQDELHLLQEELGAFAGHYETTIRSLEPKPAKVLAATATIAGYEHQLRHLYGVRHAVRFPGRGMDRYRTFYSEVAREGGQEKIARVFLAFWSRPHPAESSALVHRILLDEIKRLANNHYELSAVVGRTLSPDEASALIQLYSTSLAYVGSRANGSRIKDTLESGQVFRVEYTHNKSTPAHIAQVVSLIENPPPFGSESFLDALVATNMISHGVDLERINLMTLDRLPGTVEEYIQASSRAGRQHVGLVVVILASYNLRASSVYSRFVEYHDNLERMVHPVAINRFARFALHRTLPGVLASVLLGRSRSGVNRLWERESARQYLSQQRLQVLRELKEAYCLGAGVHPPDLEQAMAVVLEEELDRLQVVLSSSQERYLTDAIHPMTSLRDVEEGVQVNLATSYSVEDAKCFTRGGADGTG